MNLVAVRGRRRPRDSTRNSLEVAYTGQGDDFHVNILSILLYQEVKFLKPRLHVSVA